MKFRIGIGNFMKIYLITHPDTVIDSQRPINRWKISKDGWKQVKNLGKKRFWNNVEFIYASTEPKANLSARYWSKNHNIRMKIVAGIDEVNDRKFLPKKKLWENADLFYAAPRKSAGGWETAENCLKRMVKSINRIKNESKRKKYQSIAIVSHGAVANIYVCHLKKVRASVKTGQKKIGSWIIIDAGKNKILTKWQAY